MDIVVNGEPKQVPEGTTVATLLKRLDIEPVRVAVERNQDILAKQQFAATALVAGDNIEIIQFVGGGAPSSNPRSL